MLMGKYIRKRKGVGEIAVMEVAQVGVRTRTRAPAMAAAPDNSGADKKRRKVSGDDELSFASPSSLIDQFITPASPADSFDPCISDSSDHVSDSCCSSNGSTRRKERRPELAADLEDENAENETSRYNLDRKKSRRETTESTEFQPKSGELESTATPSSEATSRRITMVERMPPEAELEEFFASAEKNIHKQFTEKYNFDILKEVPLEGRYEWVKLKQ